MEKANMLDGSLYVEFGAGRAGLSSYVSSGCQNKHAVFLAIDRDSRRFKLDKEIKANGFDSIREKMDIADFDLVKWLSLRPATAGVIAVVIVVGGVCGSVVVVEPAVAVDACEAAVVVPDDADGAVEDGREHGPHDEEEEAGGEQVDERGRLGAQESAAACVMRVNWVNGAAVISRVINQG